MKRMSDREYTAEENRIFGELGPVTVPKLMAEARRARESEARLLEALKELVDLVDDIRAGDYVPDTFTTQPGRAATAEAEQ